MLCYFFPDIHTSNDSKVTRRIFLFAYNVVSSTPFWFPLNNSMLLSIPRTVSKKRRRRASQIILVYYGIQISLETSLGRQPPLKNTFLNPRPVRVGAAVNPPPSPPRAIASFNYTESLFVDPYGKHAVFNRLNLGCPNYGPRAK